MATYVDLTGRFPYKGNVLWSDLDQLCQNDEWLKANGWATGTVTPFFQAAAPTGWTKVVTQNDKVMRVVSGAGGGSGGSAALSAAISLAHTSHSIATTGTAHTHTAPHTHQIASVVYTDRNALSSYVINSGAVQVQEKSVSGGSGTSLSSQTVQVDPGTNGTSTHNHGGNTLTSQLTDITLAYIDVINCSKDTSSGYVSQIGLLTPTEKIDFDPFNQMAANDAFNNARLIPATSVAIFGQAAAPTGWTKLTTQDNKGLRIVSGTGGGTGGSAGFGSTIALAHSGHTTSSDGSHNHTLVQHRHDIDTATASSIAGGVVSKWLSVDGSNNIQSRDGTAVSASVIEGRTDNNGLSDTTTTDGAHTHTFGSALTDTTLAYFDVIQCSKDSTGAGHVYTDLTAEFAWKKLVSKQRLANLVGNDVYVKYHTIPSTSVMFFFQSAAPAGWTKLATQNDRGLRVVSGGTGGTAGGTTLISAGLTLAHTHSISNFAHTHTISTHTHNITTSTQANAGATESKWLTNQGSPNSAQIATRGGATSDLFWTNQFTTVFATTGSNSNSHGGTTGSALSDVTLAYIDMIMCQKN